MPPNDDLLRRLRATFRDEANEHLQGLNRDLLALEANPPAEQAARLLGEIFRAAHTLKGAARAVNLEAVSQVAHALETLFGRLRDGRLDYTAGVFDHIYQALDALSALIQAGLAGEPAAVDVPALIAGLEATASQPQPPGAVSAEPADAARLGRVTEALSPQMHQPKAISRVEGEPNLPEQPTRGDETMRIATAKVDALMTKVGELQVARIANEARLAELRSLLASTENWEAEWRKTGERYRRRRHPDAAAALASAIDFMEQNEAHLRSTRAQLAQLRAWLEADNRQLAQLVTDLQDEVRQTRLRPLATVVDLFPRMVRDLAQELGKQVTLVIQGGEIEVDRSVLEQIKDPLMHLLRNSVDHGLETPAVRSAAGKAPAGRLELAASQQGSSLRIEVTDDGAGIDIEQVKRQAAQLGVLPPEAVGTLTGEAALSLIFHGGLSTRAAASAVSGRGIGLDVVRRNIERLNGWVEVESHRGQGTRFVLSLPLSVTTTLCVLARAGGQTFGVPASSVRRIVRVGPEDIKRLDGREVIQVEGQPLLLARLSEALGLKSQAPPAGGRRPVLIIGSTERRHAMLVDAVLGAQDVTAKGLPRPWLRVRHVAAAAILGTGEVILVLSPADLARSVARAPLPNVAAALPVSEPAQAPTIMVVDDSMTTRTLEKNILEAAGYRVLLAGDGVEAWTRLQTDACDLLVADVNMPRMHGFQLAETVRADTRLKHLPIILVTSLDSRDDLERGIQAGADAYIVKGAFDQDQLLATIRRLI